MNAYIQQFLAFWMQLKPRERTMLSVGAAFFVLVFIYLAIWEPLVNKADRLKTAVKEQKELVQWMQRASQEARQLQGSGANRARPTTGQSLLGVIDATAKRGDLGNAMKRVEPEGANRVRVWMEQASFDDMIRWIDQLQTEYSFAVESAVIDKEPISGRVSARLVFTGGGAS